MIYVMRHGESSVNIARRLTCRDLSGELTEQGREQSARAAAWLDDKRIGAIYTSPFQRAQETAAIIGDALGIAPEVDDDLCEMDCGDLEGRTDEDAWDIWAGVMARWKAVEWDAAFPGGESLRDVQQRLLRALVRTATAPHNVVLVTHGGVSLRVMLCVNAAALQRVEDLANTGLVLLEPYDAGRFACEAWNLCEHLG
jgi:probable phosphoglycerate mutase